MHSLSIKVFRLVRNEKGHLLFMGLAPSKGLMQLGSFVVRQRSSSRCKCCRCGKPLIGCKTGQVMAPTIRRRVLRNMKVDGRSLVMLCGL